jgi:secernin
MCDTYICLSSSTKDGSTIFGKNSDRIISEAQLVTYSPHIKYPKGTKLKCTHISIPQATETAAVLLSQPYYMYGAEMGANEYNVVIGNEAIITKEPLRDSGLLGMDLLRLGLERGKSAKEALDTIIKLLEEYGQGGSHNLNGANYHNSFIIADYKEAYVLEAAGDWWVVEIIKDFRSISNDITIRGKGDMRRESIINHAVEKGYCRDDNDFDFALTFSSQNALLSYLECSNKQIMQNKGNITPSLMMNFLRNHEGNICRHKRSDLTAGSQVSYLRENNKKSIHWFTGSMLTCQSIFKPYIFPIIEQRIEVPEPKSEINSDWYWKKHADFVKSFIINPTTKKPDRDTFISKSRKIEEEIITEVNKLISRENEIEPEEFLDQIEAINLHSWQKSIELIK